MSILPMNNNKTVVVISNMHEQFADAASILRGEGLKVRFETRISEDLMTAGAEPNLIISELAVPDVDGLRLCCHMRDEYSPSPTPILLVGDLPRESSIVEDGFRCGATGYLQKPLDPLRLVNMCRAILSTNRDEDSQAQPENLFSTMIGNIFDDGGINPLSAEIPEEEFPIDRMLRDDALRASIFDKTEVGIGVFSSSGDIIELNGVLRRLLDYSDDDYCDMALSDFLYPSDAENDRRAISEVLSGRRLHYKFENGYLKSSGERVWGNLTIVSIPNGESYFLTAIFDDPTEDENERVFLRTRRRPKPEFKNILDFNAWKLDKGLICAN